MPHGRIWIQRLQIDGRGLKSTGKTILLGSACLFFFFFNLKA